jgi:hypothetical protein
MRLIFKTIEQHQDRADSEAEPESTLLAMNNLRSEPKENSHLKNISVCGLLTMEPTDIHWFMRSN